MLAAAPGAGYRRLASRPKAGQAGQPSMPQKVMAIDLFAATAAATICHATGRRPPLTICSSATEVAGICHAAQPVPTAATWPRRRNTQPRFSERVRGVHRPGDARRGDNMTTTTLPNAGGNLKRIFYRPPFVGLLAFFVVFIMQGLGHTQMVLMEAIFGEQYVYQSAALTGLIGAVCFSPAPASGPAGWSSPTSGQPTYWGCRTSWTSTRRGKSPPRPSTW